MIGRNELTAIINTCYDAVNQSKAGPILIGDGQLNSLGMNTFLYAVQKLVPMELENKVSAEFTEHKADGSTVVHEQTGKEFLGE